MINNQFYFIPGSVKTLAQLFSHREPHVLARADLISLLRPSSNRAQTVSLSPTLRKTASSTPRNFSNSARRSAWSCW